VKVREEDVAKGAEEVKEGGDVETTHVALPPAAPPTPIVVQSRLMAVIKSMRPAEKKLMREEE